MSKRWTIALAVALGVLGAALPAGADPAAEPAAHFELVRTTTGPTDLQFVAHLSPLDGGDMDAFVGAVAIRTGEDGAVLAAEPVLATTIGHSEEPEVYRDGERVAAVPCDLPACLTSHSAGATFFILKEDDGGSDVMNRYYVVFEGANVDVDLQADGWEVHETNLAYRYVDWRAAQGGGAGAYGQGVSTFSSASADGGALGSVAIAQPPCSKNVVPLVGGGVGSITLTGGEHESTAECPALYPATSGHAAEAVRWSAQGTAAGDHTLNEVPLFVVDLPPCDRRVAGAVGTVEGVTCG